MNLWVSSFEPLRILIWNCDLYFVSRRKYSVLRGISDVKQYTNDIILSSAIHYGSDRRGTNYRNKIFTKLRAVYMYTSTRAVTRLKIPHIFSIYFGFCQYYRDKGILIFRNILDCEKNGENICLVIMIIMFP